MVNQREGFFRLNMLSVIKRLQGAGEGSSRGEEVIIELQLGMTAALFNYWTGDKIKPVSNEPVNKPVCCDSVLTSSVVIGGLHVITLSVK